jgi:cytochrome P450
MQNLRLSCSDLYFAAQQTTISTLTFLMLYVLLDQRVQAKMQNELDKLDPAKRIAMSDRTKLPYIQAVIMVKLQYNLNRQ